MNVSFNAGKKGRLVLKIFALGWKTWKKCIIKQDKNKNTFYETKKKKKGGCKREDATSVLSEVAL